MQRLYEPRAYGPAPVDDNFWKVDTPPIPETEGTLRSDVVIIGAGFTGLNAALTLAERGVDVIALDAQSPGWGASGRNGGFCCVGGDRLDTKTLTRLYGADELATYRNTQRAAIDFVAERLDTLGIDADRHSTGETCIAHRRRDWSSLKTYAAEMGMQFGVRSTLIPKGALREHGMAGSDFHGAVTMPLGFALNPGAYAAGLTAAAQAAGARLFAKSPAIAVRYNKCWHVQTTKATITTDKIILATNGYGAENLPQWNRARTLPVISSVMVTRPLTPAEINAQGFSTDQMCYDTRHLLHYFRLMSDRRFLFGMRGGVSASAGSDARTARRVRRHFEAMFPDWRDVPTEHHWSGLVCLTRRGTPFAGPLAPLPKAWGAFGYHGNGVAMASYCGRLVALESLGEANLEAPAFFRANPTRFPFGQFRRTLLRAAYLGYMIRDF